MKQEITVPLMGESITEATIGTIIKPSGSTVEMDDEILELETDKVNQVLHAPQGGVLQLSVETGQVVKIGQVVGYVDQDGKPAEAKPKAEAPAQPQFKETAPPKSEQPAPPKPAAAPAKGGARMMKEEFLADLQGESQPAPEKPAKPKPASGPAPAPKAPPALPRSAPSLPIGERRETRKRMSTVRKVIAARMVEATQTTAMLTTFNEIDLSNVIALRDKYKEPFQNKYGCKLGFMSFFVSATVEALKAVPEVNSYIDGDELVHREYYDIGIAVSTERGVVVPVIRDADQLSFPEIELRIEAFARKAREGSLALEDLRGGGFTITNGGVFGSLFSTPILQPPQSGILGMHKVQKRAVVVDDQIVIRPMMYVALSYDHRVIDGKEAVTFLMQIKNYLEDPSRLLLEV